MCLMCEYYIDYCEDPGCYEKANEYNRIWTRSGSKMYLWRGYGEPCEHILEKHGPECKIRIPAGDDERDCNCWADGEGWYYEDY